MRVSAKTRELQRGEYERVSCQSLAMRAAAEMLSSSGNSQMTCVPQKTAGGPHIYARPIIRARDRAALPHKRHYGMIYEAKGVSALNC